MGVFDVPDDAPMARITMDRPQKHTCHDGEVWEVNPMGICDRCGIDVEIEDPDSFIED